MADRAPRTPRAVLAVLVLLCAATAGGCGLSDPYLAQSSTTPHTASSRGRVAPTLLRPAVAAASTPSGALRRYATIYTNWTARTLPARLRYLATVSTRAARRSALALARGEMREQTLLRSDVHSRGAVIAIARGLGADRGSWVVVTREWTTATGADSDLPRGMSHVTLATVERSGDGWVVSAWRPQE